MNEIESKVQRAIALSAGVPFGQSQFQNVFLTDDSYTPERKLRHVLLQLDTRVRALKTAEFNRRRLEVKLRALQSVYRVARFIPWLGELVEISIEEKEWGLEHEIKLVNDAVIEVETFAAMLEDLPQEMTRERFERSERTHWVAKLTRAAELEIMTQRVPSIGTLQALEKVGALQQLLEQIQKEPRTLGEAILVGKRDEFFAAKK